MDVFSVQLVVVVCLFVGNIFFGSIPTLLNKLTGHFCDNDGEWNRRVKLSSFLLYVGAGAFISDSFLVLLPQADKEFTDSENRSRQQSGNSTQTSTTEDTGHHHDNFPIPEFIVLCGFFLAFVIQEVVFFILTKLNRSSRMFIDKRVSYCTCAKRHTECSRTFKDARPDQTLFGLEKEFEESDRIPKVCDAETNVTPPVEPTAKSELLQSSILSQAIPNYGTVTNVTEPAIDNPLPSLTTPAMLANERRRAIDEYEASKYQNKFMINSMLIIIAMTLQYIFLGIHLGMEIKSFQQWPRLLATCLQNFILTFSVGTYISSGNMEISFVGLFIFVISIIPEVGLIILMISKNAFQNLAHLPKGMASAISCGILLYTTFYVMIRQKSSGSVVGLIKFLAIVAGAAIMCSLQYFLLTL